MHDRDGWLWVKTKPHINSISGFCETIFCAFFLSSCGQNFFFQFFLWTYLFGPGVENHVLTRSLFKQENKNSFTDWNKKRKIYNWVFTLIAAPTTFASAVSHTRHSNWIDTKHGWWIRIVLEQFSGLFNAVNICRNFFLSDICWDFFPDFEILFLAKFYASKFRSFL